jgi:catechol 2,3-dioxygenase-like lactoylglutathione lyase family enzyme
VEGDAVAGSVGAWAWHHTSLAVADLDEALRFYSEVLGYEVTLLARDMRDEIASMVGIPGLSCDLAQCTSPVSGHRLELIAFRGVPEDCDPRLPVRPGRAHVAYVVDDLDAALSALVAAGGAPVGAVTDFPEGRAVYCFDGCGGVVELEEQPREMAEAAR